MTMSSNIKVGMIVNIMGVYGQYQQKKIKDDYNYLNYCGTTGSKFKIQEAKEQLDKDQKELGEFLDFYI